MKLKSTSDHRTYFPGILLVSSATLLLEIAWMRVLSVTLWYHFAFMALSTALFGFGFAGVVLSLRKHADAISDKLLGVAAVSTPAAFAVGFLLSNLIPFEPFSLGRDGRQWLYLLLHTLSLTLPFFFSGLTIAALLTRCAEAVHRLYFFDLLGAGIGSLLVVLLLPTLGGAGTVLAAATLAGLGALLIVWTQSMRWRVAAGTLTFVLLFSTLIGDRAIKVRISENKVTGDGVPIAVLFSYPEHHLYTAWNTASRVDVVEWRERAKQVNRTIFIDGGTAVTRLAHPLEPVSEARPGADDESFFLGLFANPRVLVVGSGGGREVLLALRNNAKRVTAVEINPDINDIVSRKMADFTKGLYQDSRVRFFTDEARSFLGRTAERFDVIHLPHTISNAAMTAGSLSLAENYLLTLEAFREYLSRLEKKGVLLITRPEAHLPRLVSTARVAFDEDAGEDIADRVLVWRRPALGQSFYGGFAFRKEPFTKQEVTRFQHKLRRNSLQPLYLPGRTIEEPYQSLATGVDLSKVPLPFDAVLEPATDDTPFFNRRTPFSEIGWSDLIAVFSRGIQGRQALENRPVAEAALLVLLMEIALAALLFIVGPLLWFRRRAMTGRGQVYTIVAFFCLGLAYISVEMGLVQRLTLYLGRPTLVFATVFGTLLMSSGLGSAFAARQKGPRASRRAALIAGAAGLATSFVLWTMTNLTLFFPEPLRILLAMTVLAVLGFFMGMPFPLFVRDLKQAHPERIPWAFGLNGFASVVGTIGAVLVGMTLGHTAVLLLGVCGYAVAAAAAGRQ